MPVKRVFLAALIALVVGVLPLFGQGLTGQISGSLHDQSGGVVAGAVVGLTNTGTSQIRQVTSDSTGTFQFLQLLAGSYEIAVTAPGFKKYEEKGIELAASERNVLRPITLELGAISDQVTVSAEAAQLQTQSSERAGELDSEQLIETPSKGRHFLSLINLLPGVINDNNFEAPSANGSGSMRVNGSRAGAITVTIDGVPNADTGNQQGPVTIPSMESIGEIKVLLTNYQAEYGRNYGATITTVTKAGTKDFHGGAYYFFRNEALNANEFFNNRNGVRRPIYRYSYPGYYLGGPVLIPRLLKSREKIFFFWAQEFLPRVTPIAVTRATFPTALERAGNFSQTLDTNGAVIPIQDPNNNHAVFPGNIIPPSRIDPIGQGLLNQFPLPNTVDPTHTFNTLYQGDLSAPHRFEVLRVDLNLSPKTTFYARLSHTLDQLSSSAAHPWFNQFPFSNTFPEIVGTYKNPSRGGVATLIHTFSSTLINEATFGVNRFTQNLTVDPASAAKNNRATLGVNFPQFFPENNPYNVLPNATFGGVSNAPSIAWEKRFPFYGTDDAWTASDNLSKIRGKHNLKAGIYFEFVARNDTATLPVTSFQGTVDFGRNVNNPLDTNYAFSNAILGSINSYLESDKRYGLNGRYTNTEWFIQDNWRATKRLTLDIGLRFYHIVPTWSHASQLAAFVPGLYNPATAPTLIQPYLPAGGVRQGINPATGQIVPAVLIGTLAPGSGTFFDGMKTYQERIMFGPAVVPAPRFGFAWDVFGDGKTAVRGGFGIFPGRIGDDQTAAQIGQPPLYNILTAYNTTISQLALAPRSLSPNNVLALQNSFTPPTNYSGSFGVQRDVGFNTVLDVAYVTSLGRHLQQARSLNAEPYGTNFLPSSIDKTVSGNKPLPLNFLRPLPSYGDITYNEFSSSSSYHSMQTTVRRRLNHGIMLSGAWTWSKLMDLADSNTTLNPFLNAHTRNYGKGSFDRTHTLVASFDYFTPKLSTRWNNLVSRTVADDWQLSGVLSFLSGNPLGFTYTTVQNLDLTGGGGAGVDSRVDLTCNPNIPKSQRTPTRAFDTSCVAEPLDNFGEGNSAKDPIRGPGINNFDISLLKNFPIGKEGKRNIQFRFETYNTFNHTQFTTVDTIARFDATGKQVNTDFGAYTGSKDGRRVQLGLKFSF